MTQFALASMTICAPVAAATSGRTRLVRRGAADARADAIVAKSVRKTRIITLPVGRGAGNATSRDITRRRGSAVVAAGGVGVFGDDAAAGEDAGEDDAAAPLDLGEDLDALLEADSLDDSADEEDAPLDDDAPLRLVDEAPDSDPKPNERDEEPEEARVVLGGPVTDAFSGLVLAMRAKGHGETTTADAGAGGPGLPSITSYSSFANPTPWSTFDKMHAGEVKNCLGDVRRTLKAYAAHAAPAGALNERLMGAVGAAWLETRESAAADDSLPGATGKERAFVWGGGEKFATLLNDTCVHRVLFRDEPAAAGNRLVADTLMTLQDLATARVPLSADAVNVALAACAAIAEHVAGSDRAGAACDRLAKASIPPSEDAMQVVRRGGLRLVGRTGYPKEKSRDDRGSFDRGASRFDRGARSFEPGAGQDRKAGDWDCPDCGFMNFASRSECFKCGPGGGRDARGGGFDLRDARPRYDDRGRENRDGADLRPGDWKCPSCAFANFASRSECKRCGEPGGSGGGGGGGYGGGGWDRGGGGGGARVWSDEGGERGGYDRGFDRAAGRDRRYGRGAESGGGYGRGGRGRGGGRGGGGGRGRVGGRGRRDDFGGGGGGGGGGGWDDRADDGFGAY